MTFWRKKRRTLDFSEEIKAHLAHAADEFEENGMTRAEAEAAARRAFGNVTRVEEKFYEFGRWQMWDQLVRDLGFALRLLWRRPAFSVVVVLTLALGIGADTAIFSVIDAVLLRPLPYKEPSRLAMLWSEDSARGLLEGRVSLPNAADWKTRNHSFEGMTFFGPQTFLLGGKDGPPERMRSARVFADFFSILGVKPALGRVFTEEEEKRGEAVVLLSYGLWRDRFGEAANVLGQDLAMDGRKYRIIGVMPSFFHYPFEDTCVWEPITVHPYWASRDRNGSRSNSAWFALGRIRDGVSWQQAQSEMNAIGHQLQVEYPTSQNLPEIHVVPLYTQTTGRVQVPLILLLGSVTLLLLIACSNAANLLMARGTSRYVEFSVRRALGATQGRMVAQLLTESLVLAVAGALPGVLLAAAGVKALIAFGPHEMPRLNEARIDVHVLLFTLSVSLFAAAVSGLWPALKTGTTPSHSRQWNSVATRGVRRALVVAELSIALILVSSAGLMLRSFLLLKAVDPGFRPEKLLILRIDLHVGKTREQQVAYFREAIERAAALPGVRSAAAVSGFLHSDPEDSVVIEGHQQEQPGPSYDYIAGPYFETAQIPLKEGRFFSDEDRRDTSPVAIINQTMARAYWPTSDALGKRFRFPGEVSNPWYTVVGVVGDMHRQGLEKRVTPQVFLPHAQGSEDMMDVIVRTASDPLTIAAAVRSEIESVDKSVARFGVTTVEQQLGQETAERRFQTSLVGLFSLAALLLSGIGIYGLMHYFVEQRRNEIGVRMALGARYEDVVTLVMRQGLTLVGSGITIGSVAALGITRLFSSLLYGIGSNDPLTFLVAPVILLGAAGLACWIPARRAARIDPLAALRHD
jgi:predicted permease